MGIETNNTVIKPETAVHNEYSASSPDGKTTLKVAINEHDEVWYEVSKAGTVVIKGSKIVVYDNAHTNLLAAQGDVQFTTTFYDETWEQPWGEQRFVRDNHTEVVLQAATFAVRFRVFDDSFGFRYELSASTEPGQPAGEVTIVNEQSEFNIPLAAHAWWIPALGQNHYEHLYKKTPLSQIDTAHTPLTIEAPSDTYLAIHEAALYNYGAMNLIPTNHGLVSSITPLSNGTIATVSLPFKSPWRTVIIANTPCELGNSKIMLNLNDSSKIADTDWIIPTKFMGIWWGMFMGKFTWASGDKHGATTANAFRYINAAKQLGISALLIEGWNEGWDGDWTQNGDKMNHMRPYDDFDIRTITEYAKSQGVDLIGHHETSGNITHYESELPEAYDYYKHLGVRYIKTGYVAPRMDNGEFHSSQAGVKHYQKTVEMAAKRGIMLDIHEPVKGTGIERTWPNLMTREGVMGQEYEGGAVTPQHTAVLPFTRLLAGPLDYTPGLFNLSGTDRKVSSTLAKQLALYVTMYSPMQMAADLPEHYIGQQAFDFIRDVPVSWEVTRPLGGVIGQYYIVARKDRNSDCWFVGAVSNETARTLTVSCNFLQAHRSYIATIYRDGDSANWQGDREAHVIEQRDVTNADSFEVAIAPGGGFAIKFAPKDEAISPYPVQP